MGVMLSATLRMVFFLVLGKQKHEHHGKRKN